MLPTPHGPADAPLAEGTPDATVATGRTPDATALLRVVEHLADVADDDVAEGATPDAGEDADVAHEDAHDNGTTDDEATDGEATDGEATDGDPTDDEPTDDWTADDEATDDETPDTETAASTAAAAPAVVPDEVGPVAAALSDTRHTLDELTQPEQVFLAQQRALISELCPDTTDAAAVGALFDRVREQWTQAQDRPDLRPLADAFGVALGDLVCARVPDLRWATCRDRFGVEIVLARVDPEILVYPIAAVSQSWQTAEPGWFVTHLENVVRGVVPDDAATTP